MKTIRYCWCVIWSDAFQIRQMKNSIAFHFGFSDERPRGRNKTIFSIWIACAYECIQNTWGLIRADSDKNNKQQKLLCWREIKTDWIESTHKVFDVCLCSFRCCWLDFVFAQLLSMDRICFAMCKWENDEGDKVARPNTHTETNCERKTTDSNSWIGFEILDYALAKSDFILWILNERHSANINIDSFECQSNDARSWPSFFFCIAIERLTLTRRNCFWPFLGRCTRFVCSVNFDGWAITAFRIFLFISSILFFFISLSRLPSEKRKWMRNAKMRQLFFLTLAEHHFSVILKPVEMWTIRDYELNERRRSKSTSRSKMEIGHLIWFGFHGFGLTVFTAFFRLPFLACVAANETVNNLRSIYSRKYLCSSLFVLLAVRSMAKKSFLFAFWSSIRLPNDFLLVWKILHWFLFLLALHIYVFRWFHNSIMKS